MNISQRIIELEKGCEHYLYEDDFTDNDDLFEHSVYCGTRLVRDDKLILCDNCQAKLQLLKDIKKDVLNSIDFICETEGWTNHDNPEHVITIRRLRECVNQTLIGEEQKE